MARLPRLIDLDYLREMMPVAIWEMGLVARREAFEPANQICVCGRPQSRKDQASSAMYDT